MIQVMCRPPAHGGCNQPVSTGGMFLWNGPRPFVSGLLTALFLETGGPSVLILHLKVLFCIIQRRLPLTSLSQKSMASPRLLHTPWWMRSVICRKCSKGHADSTLAQGFLSHLHEEREKRREGLSVQNGKSVLTICEMGTFFLLQVRQDPLCENGGMIHQLLQLNSQLTALTLLAGKSHCTLGHVPLLGTYEISQVLLECFK